MVKIAFLGDIALIGRYDLATNPMANKLLETLSGRLQEYDFVVANLETPLTNKTTSRIPKSMHLRTSPVNVNLLKQLKVNAVTLANNHICDFGREGLKDTITVLERSGIEWFGAQSKSLVMNIKGEKFCLSGFCCYSTNGTGYLEKNRGTGVNALTFDNVKNQLEQDKKINAFSILSFHWGLEHTNYPSIEHVRLAKAITKMKEVIIHGHHPHVIQGVQKINHSIVAYSMGNCLFDDCVAINKRFCLRQNAENKRSFILEVCIEDGRIRASTSNGFEENESGFVYYDVCRRLEDLSQPLERIGDVAAYENMRQRQAAVAIEDKFGKRDLEWLVSRLNYYSLGARVSAVFKKRKYERHLRAFFGRQPE